MNLPNRHTIFNLILSNNLNQIRSLLDPLTLHDREVVVIQKINRKSLACHACELNFKEILKYFIDECGVGIENCFLNASETASLLSITLQNLNLGMIVFLIRHGFRVHDYRVCYVINDILFNEYFSLSCILCLYKESGQFTFDLDIKNRETESFYTLVSYDDRSVSFLDASARGNLTYMKLLLACGVDINLTNDRNHNALCLAILNGHKPAEEYLMKHKIYSIETYISSLELCGAKFIIFRSAKLKGLQCWKQSLEFRKTYGFAPKGDPINNFAEEFKNDQYFQYYAETDNGDIYRQALVVLQRLLTNKSEVVHKAFAIVAQQPYFRKNIEESLEVLAQLHYFPKDPEIKSDQPSLTALCTLRNLYRLNFLADLKTSEGYMSGIRNLSDFLSTSRWCKLLNSHDEFYRLAYTELVRTFLFQITLIIRYDLSCEDLLFVKNVIDDISTRSSKPFPKFDENEFPVNIKSIVVNHSLNQKKPHDKKNQQNLARTLFILQNKKLRNIPSPTREQWKYIRESRKLGSLNKVYHYCKQQ